MQDIAWEDLYDIKQKEIQELKQEIEQLKSTYSNIQIPSINQGIIKKKSLNTSQQLQKDFYSKFYIEKLRDIFFRYAGVFSYNENLIDLSNFRLIFKELSLGHRDLN